MDKNLIVFLYFRGRRVGVLGKKDIVWEFVRRKGKIRNSFGVGVKEEFGIVEIGIFIYFRLFGCF